MLDLIALSVFKQFVNLGKITIRVADKKPVTSFGKHDGPEVMVT